MDYYNVLGVSPTASNADIKTAYRKLAKENHPDRGGDSEKFKQINEAYDTLKDSTKRAAYDHVQTRSQSNRFYNQSQDNAEFNDIFVDLNEVFSGFGFGSQPIRRRQRRNRDLNISIIVTLEEILNDVSKTVSVRNVNGERKLVNITIPRHCNNGDTLKYKELGDSSMTSLPPGDLFVNIQIEDHPYFKKERENLYYDLTVNLVDAIAGGSPEIHSIEGKKLKVKIPPGTQYGTVMKIPNHGMYTKSGSRGSLFVKVLVKIPENLTEEQLNIIRRLYEN